MKYLKGTVLLLAVGMLSGCYVGPPGWGPGWHRGYYGGHPGWYDGGGVWRGEWVRGGWRYR